MSDQSVTFRIGGAALLLLTPLTIGGGVLFFTVVGQAVTSSSTGQAALSRIAQVGPVFRIVNALFHLTPVLLIPGMVAIFILAAGQRPGQALIGLVLGVVSVVIPLGWIFALNEGLYRLSQAYSATRDDVERAGLTAAASMNLGTQSGGELLQSVLGGGWVLFAAIALRATWPDEWQFYLGIGAGVGLILSGFAAALPMVPVLGSILGILARVGILLFVIWSLITGLRLVTTPV